MAMRDLSAALFAADSLFSEADAVVNAGRTDARLTVKASFKSGSFGIEFNSAVSLAEKFRDFFKGDSATEIVNAAAIFALIFGSGGLFGLVKWLGRKRPTKIEPQGEGKIRFYLGDNYFETEAKVLELFRAFKVRKALEEVVATPLSKEGISDFAVVQKSLVVVSASKEEAQSFLTDIAPEGGLSDSIRETWLNIVSATFKQGDKWRFSDGSSSFYASVSDPDFLSKVSRNEVEFGSATKLRVQIRRFNPSIQKGSYTKKTKFRRFLRLQSR